MNDIQKSRVFLDKLYELQNEGKDCVGAIEEARKFVSDLDKEMEGSKTHTGVFESLVDASLNSRMDDINMRSLSRQSLGLSIMKGIKDQSEGIKAGEEFLESLKQCRVCTREVENLDRLQVCDDPICQSLNNVDIGRRKDDECPF